MVGGMCDVKGCSLSENARLGKAGRGTNVHCPGLNEQPPVLAHRLPQTGQVVAQARRLVTEEPDARQFLEYLLGLPDELAQGGGAGAAAGTHVLDGGGAEAGQAVQARGQGVLFKGDLKQRRGVAIRPGPPQGR